MQYFAEESVRLYKILWLRNALAVRMIEGKSVDDHSGCLLQF